MARLQSSQRLPMNRRIESSIVVGLPIREMLSASSWLASVSLSATTPSQSKMMSSGTTLSAIEVTTISVWNGSRVQQRRDLGLLGGRYDLECKLDCAPGRALPVRCWGHRLAI